MAPPGPDGTPPGLLSRSFAWWEKTFPTFSIKVKDSIKYLISKEYESTDGNTPKQRKASRSIRIKGFLSFSSLGFGAMCWGGATKVLEHVKHKHPEQASYCVMYLTFAFLCQMIGLISATFPSSSPWAFFFAGLGAWQSAIFGLAIFHLNVMEYHEELKHAEISMIASSLAVTFYWSVGPQDPMFLHFLGKLLIGSVYTLWIVIVWASLLIAKAVYFIVCIPFSAIRFLWGSGGNMKWFATGSGNQGTLPRRRHQS